MPREALKKAGSASAAAAARAVMPWWDKAIEGVQDEVRSLREDLLKELRAMREEFHNEVRALDARVDGVRQEIVDRSEQHRDLVNELSHRVTRLDGKLEGYTEAMGLRLNLPEVRRQPRKRQAG